MSGAGVEENMTLNLTPLVLENRLRARLKFKQLQLLVMVAEHNNILRAAQVLNMAQPAATKTIRELEQTLGMDLFDRTSRGVTTTLFGEVVVRHAKLILSQLRHASEELVSLNTGTTGKIAVGTLLAAAPTLLPRAIVLLKKERPNINIQVVEGTNDKLMPMLRVGDLDMVVGRLPEYRERDGLSQEVLYYEPVSIVARKDHPLAGRGELTLADLMDEEWILPPPQTSLRRQIETAFRKAGLQPPIKTVESVSILTNHTLLLETDMVAAMPYQVVQSQPGLVRLPVNLRTALGPVGITLRTGVDLTPAATYFAGALRRVAKDVSADREMN